MAVLVGEKRGWSAIGDEGGEALDGGQPLLYFQPIVTAGGRQMVAAEALLRWRTKEREVLVPADFLPALERDGRIVEIGAWVFEAACRQARSWLATAAPGFRVMVNVSTRQLVRSDLVETVQKALDDNGLPGSALEIEICERFPGWSWPGTQLQLERLRELGVRIAVDDYGVGYSSMALFRELPLDTLKLDRSLVADGYDGWRAATLAATAAAGRRLGLRLIAEGVETEEQAAQATGCGCEELQGFLYGRPMPALALSQLLSAAGTAW